MIPVHYLPPGDQWDQTLVRLLLTNRLYPTPWEFAEATYGTEWPDADGLILATGHYRNGILLAPVTARSVAGLVRGEEPGVVSAADPERFTRQEAGS